jgi:S-adenosylmethionine decarboxylase
MTPACLASPRPPRVAPTPSSHGRPLPGAGGHTRTKYGPHLMMNLVGCNPDTIRDADFVYRFLKRVVAGIGMHAMGSPHLDLYDGIHADWDGWSATIHIQESHITCHVFNWGYVFLDIFSCKDFDTRKAWELVTELLEADRHLPRFHDPEAPAAQAALAFLEGKTSYMDRVDRGANFPPSLK